MSEALRVVRCKVCKVEITPNQFEKQTKMQALEEHMEELHPEYYRQVHGYLKEQDEKIATFQRVVDEQESGNAPIGEGDE